MCCNEEHTLDLHRASLASTSIDRKVALALELERAVLGADARIVGIESAEYVDTVHEYAIVSTTGIRRTGRETGCFISVYTLAEADGETQNGFGWSVGRELRRGARGLPALGVY
mgnify:CR=1 FL=1